MTDDIQIRKVTSVMYAIVSMIVIWTGIFFMNDHFGLIVIDEKSFNISTVVLCSMLAIPLAYMLYVGRIVESVIGIMIYPIVCGHSVAYLIGCPEYGVMIDTAVVLVSVALVLTMIQDRERTLVALGCLLTIGSLVSEIIIHDDSINVVRGTLLLLGGLMFALHSGIEMRRIALGTQTCGEVRRAKNPTSVCETIGLLSLGIGIIFELVMMNFPSNANEMLPEIIVASMLVVAMAIALFASVNGSISTGTTILVISTFVLLTAIVSRQPSISISNNVRFVLAVPLLFTAYRYHMKKDMLLKTATLLFVVTMVFDFIGTNIGGNTMYVFADVTELASASIFIYAAVARMMYVETGERIVPLFDGGSFVNEKEARERQRTEVRSSMAINSFMMAGLALIFLGFYLINDVYGFTKIDDTMFQISLTVISGFTILFAADNFRRGQMTEFVGLVSVGISAASFSVCGLYSLPMVSTLDSVMAVAMLIGGTILCARHDWWVGSSLIIAALGFFAVIISSEDVPTAIGGLLMTISGTIVFLVYSHVKLTTKEKNPSIGLHNIDRQMPGDYPETVCMLMLGFVMMLVAISGMQDMKSIIITTMLSCITIAISLYGLIKGNMLYNVPVFVMSLLLIVQNVTYMIADGGSFDFINIVFIVVFAFVTTVFSRRKEYLPVATMALVMAGLILRATVGWSPATQILIFVAGLAMCLICVYWWVMDERLFDKFGTLRNIGTH